MHIHVIKLLQNLLETIWPGYATLKEFVSRFSSFHLDFDLIRLITLLLVANSVLICLFGEIQIYSESLKIYYYISV